MTIDKNFIGKFVNITSKAALASSYLVGKKDKIAADKAAVDSMRSELNNLEMIGQIVIGEGELDEASSNSPSPITCLLYTSPSPRDGLLSRMPSSA